MAKNDELNVWYEDQRVGRLWHNQAGEIGFEYCENWLQKGFPISQQLPFCKSIYLPEENISHRYFANLLPEAASRAHIIRQLKIVDSDFNLLKAIGGECAGALSLLSSNMSPEAKDAYSLISKIELDKIIQQRGQIYRVNIKEKLPRLSLAGAQDKIALFKKGQTYFLPQGGSPSSHIIKFELPDFKNVPLYEFFLMRLAEAIGLPIAEVFLEKSNDKNFLLIQRYDRELTPDHKIVRLHQEDFCQGLGVSHLNKYQHDGGPSFAECYNLIQKVSNRPTQDKANLLKWQIFNVICGNSDGHAKNLAFLYNNKQISLAPFYDLVCTRAIENVDSSLAMSVGGEYNLDKVSVAHWRNLAEECKISERFLMKLLSETVMKINIEFDKLYKKYCDEYPALQRVKSIITKQCKKFLNK